MYERFVVDLENNHHYVLIDVVTGYQYYTPAQDDARVICGLLNSQNERLNNQREQINSLKKKLEICGVKDNTIEKYCNTCAHCDDSSLRFGGKDIWCEVKERSFYKYDYCSAWEGKK